MYGQLADAVVVLHLLFIVFVTFGGLLALRWLRVVWGLAAVESRMVRMDVIMIALAKLLRGITRWTRITRYT